MEEIELRKYVTLTSPGERWTKAELLLTPEIFTSVAKDSVTINVTLVQKGEKIHQWRFTRLRKTCLSCLHGLNNDRIFCILPSSIFK